MSSTTSTSTEAKLQQAPPNNNVAVYMKWAGTILWSTVYMVWTIQGVLNGFCPCPYFCLAYDIVWEGSFALFAPTKPSSRKMYLTWFMFDAPLVLLCFYGGNGQYQENLWLTRFLFLLSLAFWGVISAACILGGEKSTTYFKYFSVPFDVYLAYGFAQGMMGRNVMQTTNFWDMLVALLKFGGDFFYLVPICHAEALKLSVGDKQAVDKRQLSIALVITTSSVILYNIVFVKTIAQALKVFN